MVSLRQQAQSPNPKPPAHCSFPGVTCQWPRGLSPNLEGGQTDFDLSSLSAKDYILENECPVNILDSKGKSVQGMGWPQESANVECPSLDS